MRRRSSNSINDQFGPIAEEWQTNDIIEVIAASTVASCVAELMRDRDVDYAWSQVDNSYRFVGEMLDRKPDVQHIDGAAVWR